MFLIECLCIVIGKMFILRKMGEPFWAGLIPFYSEYLLFKHCWNTKMFFTLAALSLGLSLDCQIANMTFDSFEIFTFNTVWLIHVAAELIGLVIAIALLIIVIVAHYKLAVSFGHRIGYTVGLLVFPFAFYLLLGLSKDAYCPENLRND